MNNIKKILPTIFVLLLTLPVFAQKIFTISDLTGSYFIGHRFGGSDIALKIDGTFSMSASDCTTSYNTLGTYTFTDGSLHFTILKKTEKQHGDSPEVVIFDPTKNVFPPKTEKFRTEFRLLPIRWASRIYLMDEDDLNDFVHAINLGLEPRSEASAEPYYGSFYLREGDEKKKAQGKPILPKQIKPYWLNKAIVATVTNVEERKNDSVVTINKGSRNGLKVGIPLLAEAEEPSPWFATKIVAISKKTSQVRVARNVKIGDKLSTKFDRRYFYR
jgi:hypothetical protein